MEEKSNSLFLARFKLWVEAQVPRNHLLVRQLLLQQLPLPQPPLQPNLLKEIPLNLQVHKLHHRHQLFNIHSSLLHSVLLQLFLPLCKDLLQKRIHQKKRKRMMVELSLLRLQHLRHNRALTKFKILWPKSHQPLTPQSMK